MLNKIVPVVKEAGKMMRNAHDGESLSHSKPGSQNYVTDYDVAIQKFIRESFEKLFPEASFMGEEDDSRGDVTGLHFIVDPIDGTTNFMQNLNLSVVSVALVSGSETTVGVIYNPYSDELFTAEKGKGAFLNGKKITVSDRDLSDGLALFGTSPYHRENADETFKILRKVYDVSRDIRRSGTAALDLCYVAAGKCEMFFEKHLMPWDIAAGKLMIEEAGGVVTRFDGSESCVNEPNDLIAANPKAHRAFLEILEKTL